MEVIAEFKIHHHRILDENSKLLSDMPSIISDEDLINFYKVMSLIRIFDKKAVNLQRTGKMGTYASTLGQEAISTAIGFAMNEEDVLAPFYRDYAAMYQRGVRLSEILAYWGGYETGSCYQNNRYDLPISVPIASQTLHAAGIARAFQLRGESRVAVSTLGDGGTSQGDFYESLNVGGAWNLPLVIVVNNNRWAISVPLEKQTSCETLAQKAIAAGANGIQVDGNDMIATYQVIKEAIENARAGKGPQLVEALTYRLCDHTTADDASRYRSSEEVEQAWLKEPIQRLRKFLIDSKKADEALLTKIDDANQIHVDKEVEVYLNLPSPNVADMFDYHYATLPESLEVQKQIALSQEGS